MIYVDRSTVAPPDSLSSIAGAAERELIAAREYYGAELPPEKSYPFSAYKGDDVREALTQLFFDKCAYCESYFGATQPVDIEHYRPKAGVEEDPEHPGYWWLAMKWDNLLPSCIDCNRRRRQVRVLPGMTLSQLEHGLIEKNNDSSGKKDAFPTKNNKWINKEDAEINEEQPLLINPTTVNPDSYFDWPIDSGISLVLPLVDANGVEIPEATTSIYICGLNRFGLVQARTRLLTTLQVLGQQVLDLIDLASSETVGVDVRERLIDRAKIQLAAIEVHTRPTEPYSALARKYLDTLRQKLASFL